MRVCAVVARYMPETNAGAEWMLHTTLRYWQAKHGWACYVATPRPVESSEFDGVLIDPLITTGPDVIVTQLGGVPHARKLAKRYGCPLVIFAHAQNQFQHADLLVANTDYLAALAGRSRTNKSVITLHPPVTPGDYQASETGTRITLVNLSQGKGVSVFSDVAQRLPDRGFLGVVGSWGAQLVPNLPNVLLADNQPEMEEVYSLTRILLMPSHYETYGRVCVEAACSGIPTLAKLNPGPYEALGDAGIWCETTTDYVDAIRCLDDPAMYQHHSKMARERAEWCWQRSEAELEHLAERIGAL